MRLFVTRMKGTIIHLFVIFLGLSHLLCFKAVPVTRSESLMQSAQVHLASMNVNNHKVQICIEKNLDVLVYIIVTELFYYLKTLLNVMKKVKLVLLMSYRLHSSKRETCHWMNLLFLKGWIWNSMTIHHQGLMVVTLQEYHILNVYNVCR
ncbi:hypothetical protein RYX36_016829 [Vicia faba]